MSNFFSKSPRIAKSIFRKSHRRNWLFSTKNNCPIQVLPEITIGRNGLCHEHIGQDLGSVICFVRLSVIDCVDQHSLKLGLSLLLLIYEVRFSCHVGVLPYFPFPTFSFRDSVITIAYFLRKMIGYWRLLQKADLIFTIKCTFDTIIKVFLEEQGMFAKSIIKCNFYR